MAAGEEKLPEDGLPPAAADAADCTETLLVIGAGAATALVCQFIPPAWRIFVVAGVAATWGLWRIPKVQAARWQAQATTAKEKWDIENSARDTLSKVVGGMVVLISLYFTWQGMNTTQQSLAVTQQGQMAERYTKAVEQLASEKPWSSAGGVYALEGIARASPEHYWPIMELLCAYVRHAAARPEGPSQPDGLLRPTPQIDAIVATLRRRYPDREYGVIDLGHAELSFAWFTPGDGGRPAPFSRAVFSTSRLYKTHFEGTRLTRAEFIDATAEKCHFEKAELTGAQFTGATLTEADFTGATLEGADFSGAILQGTEFAGARISGAIFSGADLRGADLRSAHGLTTKQLAGAQVGQSDLGKPTQLPAGMAPPPAP